ncbi:39S ribosomal protein L47, mitochondrial [Takifugu flavidus]|uniref:39S ribosomal protein L47, mitochondrial n=1 Tax=Takifugu flavidus TaxID=433684 RepID=A0A5C6MWR4_9TELE|nr:39S ribosomal protein L47, mitochondrial [Takifugu flavidus]
MAASSTVGRVLSFCKQFQNSLRISSARNSQQCTSTVIRNQADLYRESSTHFALPFTSSVSQCRTLHTTVSRRGLGDFFDLPENWGETTVKGTMDCKTTQNEEQRRSPQTLVERSMFRLETVVKERETALRLLQTGQEKGRPGDWRRNIFGYVYWYRFKEYAIPWYMNKRYKRKKFYTPKFVEPYIRLRIEKYIRGRVRRASLERRKQLKLKEKFPHMKAPAL